MAERATTEKKGMVLTTPERCKNCGLCLKACPKDAISFAEDINQAGYQYTLIDHEKCIVCGMCYVTCPDFVYEIKAY